MDEDRWTNTPCLPLRHHRTWPDPCPPRRTSPPHRPPLPQAQLAAAQSAGEVSAAVGAMKAVMLANGMQAGSRFFAAQLRAALRVGDLQVRFQLPA